MIEELKADLAKAESQLEQVKVHLHQLMGIQGYLKQKIAELEKPKVEPVKIDEAHT